MVLQKKKTPALPDGSKQSPSSSCRQLHQDYPALPSSTYYVVAISGVKQVLARTKSHVHLHVPVPVPLPLPVLGSRPRARLSSFGASCD